MHPRVSLSAISTFGWDLDADLAFYGQPREDLVTYTLDFNVTGKYAAVKSFLADLGRMHEILTVDNISLANSKASEDAVALKVQLTVYLRMVE